MKKLLYGSILLPLTMLFIFFPGCKKDDKTQPVKTDIDAAVAAFKEKIRNASEGITYTFEVNQKQRIQLRDKDGNIIHEGTQSGISTASTGMSNAAVRDCHRPFQDGKIDPTALLKRIRANYKCEKEGYLISYEYNISASYNLVENYAGTNSYAWVDYTLTDGTVFTEEIPSIKIEFMGDDPDNTALYQFKVTFTSPEIIPSATIASVKTIKPSIALFTDCRLTLQYYIDDEPGYANYYIDVVNPCDRVDKCYINPQTSTGVFMLGGSDVVGTCQAPYSVRSSFHDFEYRPKGTSTWLTAPVTCDAAINSVAWYGYQIPMQGTIAYWDLKPFPGRLPAGTYEFRYRNRYYIPYPIDGHPEAGQCIGPWTYEEASAE